MGWSTWLWTWSHPQNMNTFTGKLLCPRLAGGGTKDERLLDTEICKHFFFFFTLSFLGIIKRHFLLRTEEMFSKCRCGVSLIHTFRSCPQSFQETLRYFFQKQTTNVSWYIFNNQLIIIALYWQHIFTKDKILINHTKGKLCQA